MYTETQLVRIAKRENNKKRNYLVVNRFQGKHIPVSPSEAFNMFYELADVVREAYTGENLLCIGFAETATAIGAAVAHRCGAPYMHTTRETLPGVEYLLFSEEHSHATEQKLVRDDMEEYLGGVDRIIFVEDEVTTGKTILNIIDILQKQYPEIAKYAVASLLNGMGQQQLTQYASRGIELHYLVKTNHERYSIKADTYRGDGNYYDSLEHGDGVIEGVQIDFYSKLNARRYTDIGEYDSEIERLWNTVRNAVSLNDSMSVLVVGTEEFMYPALRIAKNMEALGCLVKSHSTTRSPIIVSTEEDYPLHERYSLASLYDSARKTYIYDLERYDCVLIVTDAPQKQTAGLKSLLAALHSRGNDRIYVVRWCLE